jgi:catechol 2,3-dioxygenase-like lactoylglutathione lyase family enzyme
MFDHVLLNVSNRGESMKFYTPALQVLGINVLYDQDKYTGDGAGSLQFWLHESENKDVTRKAHLAFPADSRKQVDEFYQAALAAGGQSNGAPGLREHGPKYYAAYVLDLEGNNIEAVCNK